MKSIKIAGLCLVAVFALSMTATGSASAEPTKPFFGQCQKVKEPKTGNAKDSQCSEKQIEGEWVEVVGGETECRETVTKEAGNYEDSGCTKKVAKKNFIKIAEPVETFSSTSGEGKLETVGGSIMACKKDSSRGKIVGPSQVRLFLSLTECSTRILTEVACETINTKELSGQLRYLKKAAPTEVGLQLKPTFGEEIAEFKCGSITIRIKGSIIGPLTSPLNTYSRTGTIRFKQTKGKQEPENFEGGSKEILEFENSITKTFEQTGLETTDNLQFQDDTQIIA